MYDYEICIVKTRKSPVLMWKSLTTAEYHVLLLGRHVPAALKAASPIRDFSMKESTEYVRSNKTKHAYIRNLTPPLLILVESCMSHSFLYFFVHNSF